MSCVIKTKAFKETAKRLGISEAQLEQIAYEYINQEEGNDFPSDSYVISKMYGEENIVLNDDQIKIWDAKYNLPKIFETREQAEAYKADASRYFNPAAIPVIQLPNGSYKVQVNQPTKENIGGVTILTPLKEEYKGKLIFAQSGTGKSAIADNVNVIDGDIILADIIGVSPESAIFVFNNMESVQKQRILERYKEAIQETVKSGKTVVTASTNVLNEADVIIYNANAEITNNRTNSPDRQGRNRYSDLEYHSSVLEKVNTAVNSRPGVQSIKLSADKFLSDYLLIDPTFKVVHKDQKLDTLHEAVENFLEAFDMSVNSLQEYDNNMPLFDTLNRTINIKSEEDITEGMGYAIAFMMQHDPQIKTLILHKMFPGIESVPGVSEGFINRLANREQGNISIPQPLRRFVGGREVVKYTEIYSRFPTKNLAIRSLGKDIAEALKQEYGYKPKKGIAAQIFDALKSFFNRITRPSYEGMKASTIHYIVDSIMRGDPSLIRGSLYKPGSTEKADLLDIETAFKENPYEEDIISKLSEIGIALTGSTAIRTEASIYRPSENLLHDIDFSCPNGTTKAGLEESLNKIFPNIQHVRTIQSKDNSKNYTETYLVLSHPYVLKPHNTVPTLKLIVDPKTGKQLGVMNLFNQEINLEEGVQGKLLDFFIGESPTIFKPKIKRIAGKKYLISDPRNAMLAKVTWQRKKDIWDYRNFIRIFSDKRVSLKTKGIQADLNKIKANKWNLSPEAVKEVESKLKQYMQEKEGSIQDVNVADYFTESNSTTASDILQHIINNSTNSDIVELANYVLDSLGNKADTIVKFNAKKKTGTRGTYTSATGQVHINKASLTGNTEAEAIRNMESTIVHEIVHALTVEAIESDAKIRKDLISLFKDFKELSVQYGIDLGYAAKNPKEFVSEFLGRPAFREALKVIPSNTKKSWFKRAMDFIKSVLHIDTKSSFYDRADNIIEKLLIDSNTKDYSHIDAISEDLNRYYIDRSEGSRAKVTTLKEQRISEIEKQLHNEEQVMSLMDIALRDRLPRDKARQLGKLRKQLKAYCDSYGVSMRMDDDFNIFNNISTLQNELAVLEQPNFEEIVVEQWYQKFAQERADETQAELDLLFRDDYEEGSTSSPVNDKFIKSDILSTEVLNTLNTVAERSTHITLDEATHVYTKDGKKLDTSATSILHDPWEAEKPINGNTWLGYDVAGPLGTTTDVIMRDYFSGTLKQSYPNMTNDQVKNFVENEAPKVREHLDARFGKGNYEVITDDKYLRMAGTIFLSDPIKNKQGQVILSEGRHTIGATMDMLVVTKEGLYYPYDFKTKRSNGSETFNSNVYQQYSDQVSGIYPQLLEVQNPELKGKVQKGSLIQFNHKYEAPLGSRDNERNGTGMFMKDARGQVYRYKYNTTTRQWEYNPIQSAIAADGTPAYTPPTFYRVHESISGKRRNIISYDAPTVMNPTYIVGMKEFNGMELIYGTIGVRDGIAIGAQNAHDGTIRIDIQALKEKYETKAWKQSKRSEDINRDFDTFEEFVSFVLTHEYAHNYIRPVTISTAGYGIVTQQIADQMKQAYLQGKQALNNYIARLPKDVQRTAIVYLHGTYGIDINLNPLSKSQIENKRVLYEAIFYKRPTATESTLSYETRVNNEAFRIIDEYKQNKESATKREYTAREEQLLSNINPSIKDFIGNPLDPAKIVVGDTVKDYLDNEFKVLGFIDENNVVLENSKGFISSKRLISTNKSTYLYKQNQEVLTPSVTDTAPTVEGMSNIITSTTLSIQNIINPNGTINWDYFEQVLNNYHNSQPDSQFAKGRYTLATREEKHFIGEGNTLNHIKFVTQSMLNLLEGKFDVDLPFVSEARANLRNQKDLMILAAMFHDTAKPYRHGDVHGWESADILRDVVGANYNNRLAEWAVRHHMPMPFSHKADFNLSNPEAIEVAKNIARDALRIGIDANTAINAFVLINAADIINGRELSVEDNWAKKALAEGKSKYGKDISVKNVLTIELNEKVELLRKAFDLVKDENLGDTRQNYNTQERFDYTAYPEGGRQDGKLPYLNKVQQRAYYEGNITPDANTVFVFGSNPEGRHGLGAAKTAREQFGAQYGVGEGMTGNAYALPTKDLRVKENKSLRSIPESTIIESIKKLYQTAKENPTKQFKVAYRNTTNASLNGYTGYEMIEMFKAAGEIPANIIFSKEWVDTGKFNTPVETEITKELGPKTEINIYAGTNENADLSNFAVRPFITTNVGENPSGPIAGKFNTVEGAFQAQKLAYTDSYTDAEKQNIISKLEKASGGEARRIGKNIHGLNIKAWDSVSTSLMKNLLIESFKQNPQALQKLLDTGNATLTHKQDKGKWGTEFPRLLMEVREELKPSTSSSSTDEVFRFNEEQGKEFTRLFGPYDEGGGADINKLFKQPLPREVDMDISQYNWEGVYPPNSSMQWILDNIKDEYKPALASFFSLEVESGPQVTTSSVMTSSEDIDLGDDVPAYEKSEKQKEIDKEYTGKQKTIMEQINTLMRHPDIKPAEVRHIAEQCVYWISDRLTDYQTTPEKLFNNFPNKRTLNAEKEWTEEAKQKDIEKVTNMNREQILRFIGIDNLYEACRLQVFVNNELIQNDFDLMDKADAIAENFAAIRILAADTFTAIEKFSIKLDERGNLSTTSDINKQEDDNQRENDEAQEYGNQQEHWQIESRTQDVLFSATEEVRRLLNNCYKMRADGTIIDSEFGVHERMTAKDATSSILRWTQGSLDLNDMIAKMQAKKAEHPWIQQVIDKLSDRSGKYADLQSQFFGVMQKHFQPYCVVIKENGVYKSIPVNEHPALTEATRSIKTLYNIGQHPLFNSNGINRNSYKTLEALHTQLQGLLRTPLNDSNIEQAVNVVGSIATVLGYTTLPEHVRAAITQPGKLSAMARSLTYIVGSLSRQLDNENYDPFNFNRTTNPDGISGNLRDFLEPLTEQLEDIAVSSFYDSGKMYQSYVTPSYMTKLMNKFHDSQERFLSFIEDEYGKYEWFRESGQRRIQDGWKNEWLRELVTKGEDVRKELFKHKVELNFNKHNYMKNMSDSEYTLSLLTEYFSASAEQSKGKVLAWYNIPMLSNKPSSEFIQFYRYTSNYRNILTDGFYKIFLQELGRIQTCEERASKLPQDALIKNFDTFKKGTAKEKRGNGTKFMFLEFMNAYLEGGSLANSELGKIINKKLRGEELSSEQENTLITKTKEAIQTRMDAEAESTLQKWEESGILEGAKNIENIGSNEEEIKESIRQYVWNSTFASMNILQLTITDIAYYKDAEDLQKRLAQIHAPGIRANKLATDYEGNLVSDGNFRSLILTDWDNFKSNITSNLEEVFDKKINAASSREKPQWKALKNNIIEAFSNINVADAQGFSSPTSYRKKAFLFGKWSKKYEDVYQKLMSGKYTYSDLEFAFQPLKPFVYSQNAEPSRVEAPMSQLKVGTQFKNSEYLLILADAILKGERTGRPNLLRAIYNIMEDSANIIDKTKGIDTVQFESTTKAGLKGKLNLLPFINHPNGEQAAYDYMKKAIFNATVEQRDGLEKPVTVLGYNDVYVKTVDFEDYCLQQEVPEHFKDHSQAHGSQIRYIIPSDLEEYHSDGVTPVKYSFMDKGVKKELSAEEFKKEYEDNIYQNIQESIQELSQELGLGKFYTSIKDRNIALSKILQREILSSPRYGIDLLIACSVDEATGEFRIPLGDPIQSKRVEQLINSIIKNRVNKQKIAGGPIVQVSNFGTSKELNIRFNDKNGNLLMTKLEYAEKMAANWKLQGHDEALPAEMVDAQYKEYIRVNQGGIAYYEVFVPIYANELFKEFADDKGNINIEDIEAVAPDMLKMIGYRIPSEDKYSCAPMKVVGFLPREAGDAIMLPADITTITGSDFDVDKFYVMRKEILLSKRVELKEGQNPTEAELDYIKHNRTSIINYLRTNVTGIAPISQAKRNAITKDVTEEYELRKRTETRRYKEEVEKIESRNDQIEDAIANVTYSNNAEKDSEIYDKKVDKQEKQYQKALENAKKKHEAKLAQLDAERDDKIEKLIEHERYFKTTEFIIDFLRNPHQEATNSSLRALKYAYMNYMYHAIEETSGRSYRNNKIIDMTWAVLTHETTAEKILNPGGFDEQKGMGYAVEAQRLNPDLSWDYLEGLSTTPKGIDTLKDLCYTSKNICYPIVNIQFYKQNSAAGAALGMAAVQKVAHAVLEGNGYQLDIDAICNLPQNENGDFIPFTIAGKTFGGGQKMEMDPKFNDEGALIGKTLGSEVAMFADAVKDPVANLMNINGMMMPIVNSLVRLGMPFRNVALFTSQSVIRECLLQFNTENISNYVSISDIINKKKKKIEDDYNLNQSAEEAEMSSINTEELTKEELIKGINPNTPKAEADAIAYKVLTMWQYISRIADAMRGPTFATRFNSISNAVGPQIVDNLIMEHKQSQFSQHIYNAQDEQIGIQDIFDKHPILRGFNQTLDIATELFGNMPANSNTFKELLSIAPENIQRKLYGDKKLLSQLTEFFLSYMLVANGTIDTSKLKEYITQFPAEYLSQNYKEKYPDNALIQAIKPDYEKKSGRAVLKVDTTGLDTKQKEELSTAWVDLHNQNPELSEKLFIYNFFKGGVVFSPKTFMALVHPLVKEQLFMEEGKSKYLETYRHSANIDELLSKFILDQFIRNNWDNNKLVPKVKFSKAFNEKGQIEFTSKEDIKKYKDLLYMKNGFMNNFTLFKQVFADDTKVVFEKVQPLGNNHEYIEMSRDNIIEALDMTVKPSEEDNNHDVPDQSRTDTADIIEEPIAKTEVQQQQNDKFSMQNLYEALASHPAIKTIESAKSNVADFKARWSTFDNATKEAKKQNMMNVLLGRYKAIGINLNQEELERVFNLMC